MSPQNKKKLNSLRKKLDRLDNDLLKIVKKRTGIIKQVISTKEFAPTETTTVEEEKEEKLCPTCKNNLVFVEGCSICIECGYSGCTSG